MSRFIQAGLSNPTPKGRPKKEKPLAKPGTYTAKELEKTKPIRTMSGKL